MNISTHSKVNSFLASLEGNVVVMNYNGVNVESVKLFTDFDWNYNEMDECYYLSNREDEVIPYRIQTRDFDSVHIDVNGMVVSFTNGESIEIYTENFDEK